MTLKTTREYNCLVATWALILVTLALRLLIGARFPLVPDEANYWQWSRHLALCYHDHPPMIGWTIWLATRLLGQTELAVRLPTILGLTLTAIYLGLLAARWFSCRVAFHTVLLLQAVLLYNGAALIATPDGLLIPCWAAATYHAGMALSERSPGHWLATGVWFGLGMLSKYTMALFPASLFLAMLAIGGYRRQLTTVWPWLGLILGMALFSPVLIWNSQHDWATFRHVLYQGGADNQALITLRFIGDFLGTQILLLTPLVFLMLGMAWLKPVRNGLRHPDIVFLKLISLTGFLAFFVLALHVRIYGNWPAPCYLTGIILVAALFSPGRVHGRGSGLWKSATVLALSMSLLVVGQTLYPLLPLPVSLDRAARETVGWRDLAREVTRERAAMPHPDDTFVFGLRYQQASELAFYMEGQPETVSINRWTRPNVYDYWITDRDLIGKDGVGVYEWKGMASRIATLFDRVDPPRELRFYRQSPWLGRQLVRTLYLIRGYGFRGGLRWQPRDPDDIRAGKKLSATPVDRRGRHGLRQAVAQRSEVCSDNG